MFQENVIKGSEQYLRKNAVQNIMQSGNSISADVKGLDDFHVKVETSGDEIAGMECSCPLSKSGQKCKHMAAVLLYADENGLLNKSGAFVDENFSVEATDEGPETSEENEVVAEAEAVAEPEMITEAEPEIKAEVEPVAESEMVAEGEPTQEPVINAGDEESGTVLATEETEETEATESEDSELEIPDDNETAIEPDKEKDTEKTTEMNISEVSSTSKSNSIEEKSIIQPTVNWQFVMNHDENIKVTADISSMFSFALYQNGIPLLDNIVITNNSEKEYKLLVIRCYSDFLFFSPFEVLIDVLAPSETYTCKGPALRIDGSVLKKLTEKVICNLYVCVTFGGEELARYGSEISVLAINEWTGLGYDNPALLASFVTPNHQVVKKLLFDSTSYLEKQTGKSEITGYQTGERKRVLEMANAAYAAIQKKNIRYAPPPAGYVHGMQKIRLADEILTYHMGTCMDMSLLYASVIEAMELNPILVFVQGHIFSGVWLDDKYFPDSFMLDPTEIEKHIELGELVVVECTSMCSNEISVSFDDAMNAAIEKLSEYDSFKGVLDIRRARHGNVLSIPLEKNGSDFLVLDHKELNESELTDMTQKEIPTFSFDEVQKEEVTKLTQWERKLLDLSIRNPLINISKKAIPLIANNLAEMEDAFSENAEYKVFPVPKEWKAPDIDAALVSETRNQLGKSEKLIQQDLKNRMLHSIWDEKKNEKELARIYRETKDAMAESGANTLYLVLGELKWIEHTKPYYAPIVLVPIEIIRKSASEGYIIRGVDDETQVNVTLLEFLKQKFDLEIPGLIPPPMDEHGVDVAKIFAMIRSAIMKKANWAVLENAYIGNFSFTSFVMWNDIHTHPEMLRRSKVVQALMDGEVEWNTYMPSLDSKDIPYLPVNVDDSQLRAVNMAANDVSFVLHGPPGAGKSQTITAMIANAITRGKTVLFVAEKPAALNVVKKRLEQIGIGDFCIEIHSNKIKKSEVLEQFKRVRENFRVLSMSTNYNEKIEEIISRRASLNEYGIALHKQRRFGLSIREMIDEYEMIPEYPEKIRPSKELTGSITVKDYKQNTALLERLVAAGKVMGHPHGHMFTSVGQTVFSKSLKIELDDAIAGFDKSCKELLMKAEEVSKSIGIENPTSRMEWMNLFGLSDAIIKSAELPEWMFRPNATEEAVQILSAYIAKRDQMAVESQEFFSRYKEEILSIDLNIYITKYAEAERKFFGKDKAIAAVSSELEAYTTFPVTKDMVPSMSSEVTEYKNDKKEFETIKQSIPSYLQELATDSITVDQIMERKREWDGQLATVMNYSSQIAMLRSNNLITPSVPIVKDLLSKKAIFEESEKVITDLLVMSMPEDATDWIGKKKEKLNELEDNYSKLRDWISYQEIREECLSNGLEDICELYSSGLEHEKVIPVYKKCLLKALIWDVITNEPVFDKFTGNSFDESIREYKNLEDELIELTKAEMLYKLSHNLPTGYGDSKETGELRFLSKAITSNGRGLSIREIMDKAPSVTRKMCPCFLMSPLSVAQFISPESDLFDIVMFDEASQIRTCEAVGSLSRGRNAVIVGDPNQMPPTSFFVGDNFDEDNVEIEDLDSILDDCLILGMPETHLRWHYRSRHESLIAFSNQNYYENKMLTFPSVNDREKRVKLCTVNGVFKSGKDRTNEKEAQAIITEVLRRFNEENLRKYSIGIVTFNETQRKLIESLLDIEYHKNPELDAWANNGEEPLIVRNLENVQGDERDIILFSVTYGLDEDRRRPANFGPLNKEGGWRRLNVAITRAKQEIILFSSITYGMITNTAARGVEGLQAFLKFAEFGYMLDSSVEEDSRPNGIISSICKVLDENGYSYQCNIGHSSFKIDIAVVNPFDENEYLLGIMLDGDTYKASLNNTKDREISQLSILRGLGWSLHRIWTMDWWDNREEEIKELLAVLKKRKDEVQSEEGKTKDFDYCPPSEPIDAPNTTPRARKKEDSKVRKRFIKLPKVDAANRFIKDKPLVLVLEKKIYQLAEGDYFKDIIFGRIPITSIDYDNYAVYEINGISKKNYLLIVGEKPLGRIVDRFVDENQIIIDLGDELHESYSDIDASVFASILAECRNKDSIKKLFKSIRPLLEHVKCEEEEKEETEDTADATPEEETAETQEEVTEETLEETTE